MATRLAESPAVREQLDAQRTTLFALIVSDDLYQDVFMHGKGELEAGGFRRVTVDMPDKEWREDAWVRGWSPARRRRPDAAPSRRCGTRPCPRQALPGSVADLLGNPEIENELEGAGHDFAGRPVRGSHEEWMVVTESVAEDHAYFADENGYLTEDYDQRSTPRRLRVL